MTIFRVSIFGILMLLASYVILVNWGCVIASRRNSRKGIDRHHSMVSGISLILAGIAYPLYPFMPKWWIGLIPAFDIGTWMLIIGLPWAIVQGAFKSKKEQPNKTTDQQS